MRIAYVTLFDATDVNNWSGTDLHIWKALEAQGFEIELIGSLRHGPSLARKIRKSWGKFIERRSFLHFWDLATAQDYAADVAVRLRQTQADIVLSPSPIPLAFLDCPQPKVLWTDATFAGLSRMYPEFDPELLCSATVKSAKQIDCAVSRNCDLLIYAAKWGATWALNDTQVDPNKVAVVPYGANIKVEHTITDVEQMVANRGNQKIRLLFVGVDWERKGAAKAIDITAQLCERGIDAEITLVGCSPPTGFDTPAFVKPLGFISKATQEGQVRLFDLYRESHFLLVPTYAEAFGLVFAEASAFGVPSLSHKVGGVPTVVRDGLNGKLFEANQPVTDWADWIISLLNNPEAYTKLANSSFLEYKTRLNWGVAGHNAASLIRNSVKDVS